MDSSSEEEVEERKEIGEMAKKKDRFESRQLSCRDVGCKGTRAL